MLRRSIFSFVLAAAGVVAAWPAAASAAGCTDGVDCFCDRMKGNASVRWCEDFEAASLYDDVGKGPHKNAAGENIFGAWYDDSPGPYNYSYCGSNSYWTNKYGWANSTGGVTSGSRCKTRPSGTPTPLAEYSPSNQWGYSGGANDGACIDIQRAGDATKEIPSLTDPGVFDGRQVLGERLSGGGCGFYGEMKFGAAGGEWGYTSATAFSSNYISVYFDEVPNDSTGVKSEEWTQGQRWPWGTYAARGAGLDVFPFGPTFWYSNKDQPGWSANSCPSGAGGGACSCKPGFSPTAAKGEARCTDVFLLMRPVTADYSQTRDWPLGTWGCIKGHLTGWGTKSTRMRTWVQTAKTGGERLIMDVTFDSTQTRGLVGSQNSMALDHWNALPRSEPIYRYRDNFVVTAGPPVSCADIGFGGQSSPTPPPSSGGDAPAAPILIE